jgi:uncharacterized protein (DUF433 family)
MYRTITFDPEILGGKPIIAGTRLSVEFIMELIASGATVDDIAGRFPHVPVEGIREAIEYAAHAVKNEVVISAKITA